MSQIIIGARGSKLSLIQTEIVKKKLQTVLKNTEIEIKVIKTKGDKDMSPVPLDSIGKGWFTQEIDKELLEGRIDLAVHSLKDLPESLEDGLIIAAIAEREDPRDALVSKENLSLEKLRGGAVIGTDSTRRASQILNIRSDLKIKSLRGSVVKRLEKLETEKYDGIILAVAGLKRLGLQKRITQYFDAKDFVPAPGQGALAVVIRKDNRKLKSKLELIEQKDALAAVEAERCFSNFIGGGCKTPVGAYAICEGSRLTLYGFVGSLDGRKLVRYSVAGNSERAAELGQKLAQKLLDMSKGWYKKDE